MMAVILSLPEATEASSLLWASVPAVPLVTYLSWVAALRLVWDVSHVVKEEAVDTIKAVGTEARVVAESVGFEVRGWVATAGGMVRGVVYATALMFGVFAIWCFAESLRRRWPTWPSPYAHADRTPSLPNRGYASGGSQQSLSAEVRRRSEAMRQSAMRNLAPPGAEFLAPGGSPAVTARAPELWEYKKGDFQVGDLISFVHHHHLAEAGRVRGIVRCTPYPDRHAPYFSVWFDDGTTGLYNVREISDLKVERKAFEQLAAINSLQAM